MSDPKRAQKLRVAIRRFGPFESAIRQQWEAFEKERRSGLALEAEALDLHPLHDSLFTAGGLEAGDWDVAFLSTDWLAGAHEAGSLVDLAPYLEDNPPDGYPGAWTDSLLRFQRFEDRVLGLPYHDGPECLVYRTDLFEDPNEQAAYGEQFGEPLRPPETWPEFHRMARFFTRPEAGLYGTTFAAYPDGHNTVYDFCLQLWTRGGELFDAAGRLQLDTPQARRGLEFYRAILGDATSIHPDSATFDSVKAGLAFAQGEVAMMVNWFGFAAMSETIAESKVKGNVAVGLIPSEGGSETSLNAYWVLGIGSGSQHRDLAYQFLRHCASPDMDRLLTLEGGIGCRKSTWTDPEVNRIIPFYQMLESIHRGARDLPRRTNWVQMTTAIDELVLDVINSDAPIGDLTRKAQEKLDSQGG